MTEIRIPYGRTGLWFTRMPCYLTARQRGRELHIGIVSQMTDREIRLAVHAGREAEAGRIFQALSRIYDGRAAAGCEGVDRRAGRMAVMLYGTIAAERDGIMVIDVDVQGGRISVEANV